MRSDNQPRSIQIHPSDNVAIVVNEGGLPAGARFEYGLVLPEALPEAHKVALTTLLEVAPTPRSVTTMRLARCQRCSWCGDPYSDTAKPYPHPEPWGSATSREPCGRAAAAGADASEQLLADPLLSTLYYPPAG